MFKRELSLFSVFLNLILCSINQIKSFLFETSKPFKVPTKYSRICLPLENLRFYTKHIFLRMEADDK